MAAEVAHEPTRARVVAADPTPLTNVLVVGVGFFFVIGGYNPVQSFASSLLNFSCIPMGDISIGLCYLSGSVGALLGPAVVERFGVGKTMLVCSLAFPVFAASVAVVVLPVVLATSIVFGCFGAWIWVAQGVALSACSTEDTHGLYSGILQAFNNGASLPGNMIALWLIPTSDASAPPRPCGNTTATLLAPGWDKGVSPLFLGCACCCLVGTLVLLCYRPPPPVEGAPPRPPPPTPLQSLKRIWTVCTHRTGARLLVPLMLYTGVSNAFWSGMFTRQMPTGLVGPAMCILGGGAVAGGLLVGEIVDRLGVRASCAFLVLVQAGALAVAHFANADQDKLKFWVAAGLLGVAANGAQTVAYAVLATRFQGAKGGSAVAKDAVVEDCAGSGDKATGSSGAGGGAGGGVSTWSGSVQRDGKGAGAFADEAAEPLLGPPTHHTPRRAHEGDDPIFDPIFDSTDGFSALVFVQGAAVAVLFFVLPLCSGASGRSSAIQFLCEEAVVFGLLIFAVACVWVDECLRRSR